MKQNENPGRERLPGFFSNKFVTGNKKQLFLVKFCAIL